MNKIQIRQGVFETNSSSTHSLQITKGGVNEAKSDIINNKFSICTKNFNSCINGDTLVVKGLKCETGGDESDVYTIITNWEAKLQYIASLLFGIYEDYEKEDLERLKDVFSKCAIDIYKKYNITVNNVEYKNVYTSWVEKILYPNELKSFSYDFENNEDIEEFINTIIDESYTLTFGSEAYSPYEGYTINVIK